MFVRRRCRTWSAQLSTEQKNVWLKWEEQLLNEVAVPRSIPTFQNDIESNVYAWLTKPSGFGTQGIVIAKARVAKQGLTIPRLDLVSPKSSLKQYQ